MAILTNEDKLYLTPEDICCNLGEDNERFFGAATTPIFQSSTFTGKPGTQSYVYTRVGNPTTELAERKIAALEDADGALCFASGMGAITAAIMHFIKPNCHVLMVTSAYPDAKRFCYSYLKEKMNVETSYVPGDNFDEIKAAVRDNTTLIYLESPSTGIMKMQDLEAVARLAKQNGIGTVIDNTYATPLYQKPLKWGIDISVHTVSKYLCGHSNVVGGVLCANEEIIKSIQTNERILYGSVLGPQESYYLIMGLHTFPTRMRQFEINGKAVAEFLEQHPKIDKVFHPGSSTYGQKELFNKYMTGRTGLMSFVPKTDAEGCAKLIKECKLFRNGVSWGGFESLISGKSIGMSPERCLAEDFPQNMIRISVGLENVQSLISDLDQALNKL